MIVGPRRRLHPPGDQRYRPVWRGVGGLVAATVLLGLPRACLSQERLERTPQPDRPTVVRIPGTGIDSDADGVKTPPRPPVKEQAERQSWHPGVQGPRRYLAGPQRDGPPSRSPAPGPNLPPVSLDSMPEPRSWVHDDGRPAERIGEPEPRDDATHQNASPGQAEPRLRLSVDQPAPARTLTVDEPAQSPEAPESGTAAVDRTATAPAARPSTDEDGVAPIRLRVGPAGVEELPRPQVFADEPIPQGRPSREEPVEQAPAQDPPEESAAAGQPSRSIAERIEIARDGGRPDEEPEGEDAQATDASPPGEAVLADDAGVADPSSVAAADPRPAVDPRSPVEVRLTPSRQTAAPARETIRVSVGSPGGSPAVDNSVAGAASSPSGKPGPKPIHLSLKFPAPKSAKTPESRGARAPGPAGAASGALTRPDAPVLRPGVEPVIVAKLGTGEGSAKGRSPASGQSRLKTVDHAAGPAPRPIRLTIKGSSVITQSGGETTSDKSPPASSGPQKDSKGSGSSAKEKSASTRSGSPEAAGHAARAAARLNQWTLLGTKPVPPAPSEPGSPRLLEASRRSTASLR